MPKSECTRAGRRVVSLMFLVPLATNPSRRAPPLQAGGGEGTAFDGKSPPLVALEVGRVSSAGGPSSSASGAASSASGAASSRRVPSRRAGRVSLARPAWGFVVAAGHAGLRLGHGFRLTLGILGVGLLGLGLGGCREAPRENPKPTPVAPPELCPGGVSEDPPRRDLEPGVRAFEAKKYGEAQTIFRQLAEQHPRAGSVLVWLGDAVFYDKDKPEAVAALEALPHYEAAGKLHEAGCTLPRRPRYYQLMGVAYAGLRLGKAGGVDANAPLERAEQALSELAEEFPTSAEVPYTQARLACLQAQLRPTTAPAEVARCLERFQKTLQISEGYERPRFLRTHRSTQDWLVRAETQSEFPPLRADAAYQRFVRGIVPSD